MLINNNQNTTSSNTNTSGDHATSVGHGKLVQADSRGQTRRNEDGASDDEDEEDDDYEIEDDNEEREDSDIELQMNDEDGDENAEVDIREEQAKSSIKKEPRMDVSPTSGSCSSELVQHQQQTSSPRAIAATNEH